MDRKTLFSTIVLILAFGLILGSGCTKNIGPVNPSLLIPTATPTNTASATPTSTTTKTSTNSPTPTLTSTATVAPCQTYVPWGEQSGGSSSVAISQGTYLQSYSFPQPFKLFYMWTFTDSYSASTSIQMGVYADGGGYPTTLLYSGPIAQPSYYGTITTDPGPLNPGVYWVAFAVVNGPVVVSLASGSTAKMTSVPEIMPATINMAQASADPPAASGQLYMQGIYTAANCP